MYTYLQSRIQSPYRSVAISNGLLHIEHSVGTVVLLAKDLWQKLMSQESYSSPNVKTLASRRHLKQALDALDLSDTAMGKDGGCLHCHDGLLVIRQGYTQRTVPCSQSFSGQFTVSFTSLQKWRRAQKAVAGDEVLQFADAHLKVCHLELPTKWDSEIEVPSFAIPKVLPPEAPLRTIRDDARFSSIATESKTCGTFRVNVDRQELQDAFAKLARINDGDIQLRTWGGKLILNDGNTEFRVDAEGKIDGFAVIPAAMIASLATSSASHQRFIDLVCEKYELKILGARVKTPRKANEYGKST